MPAAPPRPPGSAQRTRPRTTTWRQRRRRVAARVARRLGYARRLELACARGAAGRYRRVAHANVEAPWSQRTGGGRQVTTKLHQQILRKLHAAEATMLTPERGRIRDACLVSASGQLLYARARLRAPMACAALGRCERQLGGGPAHAPLGAAGTRFHTSSTSTGEVESLVFGLHQAASQLGTRGGGSALDALPAGPLILPRRRRPAVPCGIVGRPCGSGRLWRRRRAGGVFEGEQHRLLLSARRRPCRGRVRARVLWRPRQRSASAWLLTGRPPGACPRRCPSSDAGVLHRIAQGDRRPFRQLRVDGAPAAPSGRAASHGRPGGWVTPPSAVGAARPSTPPCRRRRHSVFGD